MSMWTLVVAPSLLAVACGAPLPPHGDPSPDPEGTMARITQGAGGQIGGDSWGPTISADGGYVAFTSSAPDLVPDDTNHHSDVFVWERATSTTTRITAGSNDSHSPSVSADGRYVAFASWASDLVPGDINGKSDLFVWDRATSTTTRITAGTGDSYGAVISGDGGTVAFESYASDLVPGDTGDTNGTSDVFVWDAASGTTTRVSDSAHASHFPALSADGRSVTYYAFASNLVPDTNDRWDVFVWDRATSTTTRVTDGDEDSLYPTISADGRYVAFSSAASNLVADDEGPGLFRWDAVTGEIIRVASGGETPIISADGGRVAFNRFGEVAVDVWVWDAGTGTATRISDGNGHSYRPQMSADGSAVTFSSRAFDLVPGDTNRSEDVFLWVRSD